MPDGNLAKPQGFVWFPAAGASDDRRRLSDDDSGGRWEERGRRGEGGERKFFVQKNIASILKQFNDRDGACGTVNM